MPPVMHTMGRIVYRVSGARHLRSDWDPLNREHCNAVRALL